MNLQSYQVANTNDHALHIKFHISLQSFSVLSVYPYSRPGILWRLKTSVIGRHDSRAVLFQKMQSSGHFLTHCCRLYVAYLEIVKPVTFLLNAALMFLNVNL